MIKYIFLGIGDSVRIGEDESVPLAIPTQPLMKTSVSTAFQRSIEVPAGFTSISSVKLFYRRTGTGNISLKFAFAYVPKAGGAPVEDVDSFSAYAGGAADGQVVPISVPAAAYSGMAAMTAGDAFFLSAYREDETSILDTYTTDVDVAGILIAYNTTEASVYNDALDIVTLAQVKDYMGVTDTTNDAMFAVWITMLSQMIENILMQPVQPITVEEILDGDGSSKLFLNKGRIVDLVVDPTSGSKLDSLEYRDSALVAWERIIEDTGLYHLDPKSSWCIELLDNYVFYSGQKNIRVYYSAGFSPLPADIVKVVLEMMQVMWDESKSGKQPRLGMTSKNRSGAGSGLGDSFLDMNPRWKLTLDRYKRLC